MAKDITVTAWFADLVNLVTTRQSFFQGRQSWGLRVATPEFGQGVIGGSWMGRKILLYRVQKVCLEVVIFEEK